MPVATRKGVDCHYETAGSGETVAFVGDCGFGAWQFAWHVDALAGPVQTLVSDHRGTGRSDAPPGPYDVATLANDLATVLADAGVDSAHLVGVGLGGLVAIETARKTRRVESLVLSGTGVDTDAADPLALQADRDDDAALRATTERALSADYRERYPQAIDDVVAWRAEEDADRDGWEAQAAAVARYDPDPLYEVTTDALVVHGTADDVWPEAGARDLADELPGAEFEPVPGAAHLAHVEASEALNDILFDRVASGDWRED
jgi:3-oxoadipate enol-lactonase